MVDHNPAVVIPNPDPSSVTTAAIDRAVAQAESLMAARVDGIAKAIETFQNDLTRVPTSVDRQITGLKEALEARLDGMDKMAAAMTACLERRPVEIKDQITHLHDLIMAEIAKISAVSVERFARIDTQFIERDKRTDQLSLADKTAVAAALQAAKEAVGAQNTSNSIAIAKSESSTVESIRQLQTLFNSAIAAVNDKLNDTRSRLDRGDGNIIGTSDAKGQSRDDKIDQRGFTFGIIGMIIGMGALVLTVVTHIMK